MLSVSCTDIVVFYFSQCEWVGRILLNGNVAVSVEVEVVAVL